MVGYEFIKGMYLNLAGCTVYANVIIGNEPRNSKWEVDVSKLKKIEKSLNLGEAYMTQNLSDLLATCYEKKKLELGENDKKKLVEMGVLGYLCGRNVAYTTVEIGDLRILPGDNQVVFKGEVYPMWPGKKDVSGVVVPDKLPTVAHEATLNAAVPILLNPGRYGDIQNNGGELVIPGKFYTGPEKTYDLGIKENSFSLDHAGGSIQLFVLTTPQPNLPKTKPELFFLLRKEWEMALAEKIMASLPKLGK